MLLVDGYQRWKLSLDEQSICYTPSLQYGYVYIFLINRILITKQSEEVEGKGKL